MTWCIENNDTYPVLLPQLFAEYNQLNLRQMSLDHLKPNIA